MFMQQSHLRFTKKNKNRYPSDNKITCSNEKTGKYLGRLKFSTISHTKKDGYKGL